MCTLSSVVMHASFSLAFLKLSFVLSSSIEDDNTEICELADISVFWRDVRTAPITQLEKRSACAPHIEPCPRHASHAFLLSSAARRLDSCEVRAFPFVSCLYRLVLCEHAELGYGFTLLYRYSYF